MINPFLFWNICISKKTIMNYSIAIHGGAGTILQSSMTKELEQAYQQGLKSALHIGYRILKEGGSSLDAVEASVKSLEDFPLFNAGKGSVFNNKGSHEMDASIMCGNTLKAGAVSSVSSIKNPVVLARTIMDKSEHVFLCKEGAEEFARLQNLDFENEAYFYNESRYNQWLEIKDSEQFQLDHSDNKLDKKFGTVGAVAIDQYGHLASATSTGGMTNKKFGRVGDTPIIGAGTYANDNTCAVSCTGHGELFIRSVVAYDISCLIEYKNLSLEDACKIVVHDKLIKIGGEGGVIAVDNKATICMAFNSEGMYRASIDKEGKELIAIYK